MGRDFADRERLKKRYLVLFLFFLLFEFSFVYYPNLQAIYRIKVEKTEYEQQLEMPTIKRRSPLKKMNVEELIEQFDSMIAEVSLEVMSKKAENSQEQDLLLTYELKSDRKGIRELFLRPEWKKRYRILNIYIERTTEDEVVCTLQAECANPGERR